LIRYQQYFGTPHKNYLKIDNTNLSPDDVAKAIKEAFAL